jgi:hypothetical protein
MEHTFKSGKYLTIAGLIWLLLWFHQSQTHGFSEDNERKLFVGATWMDSGKFYVVVYALLLLCVIFLFRARSHSSPFTKAVFALVTGSLAIVSVGTVIQFWPFPFGSYELSFEQSPLARVGGIVQALATLAFALTLVPFGIGLVRERVIHWWLIPLMVIAAISGFFLTPANFIPGVGWIAVGVALLARKETA